MQITPRPLDRRSFVKSAVAVSALATASPLVAAESATAPAPGLVRPPVGKPLLLSCKLGMIAKKSEGRELTLTERLRMAGEAGFDGVDFDDGKVTGSKWRRADEETTG